MNIATWLPESSVNLVFSNVDDSVNVDVVFTGSTSETVKTVCSSPVGCLMGVTSLNPRQRLGQKRRSTASQTITTWSVSPATSLTTSSLTRRFPPGSVCTETVNGHCWNQTHDFKKYDDVELIHFWNIYSANPSFGFYCKPLDFSLGFYSKEILNIEPVIITLWCSNNNNLRRIGNKPIDPPSAPQWVMFK